MLRASQELLARLLLPVVFLLICGVAVWSIVDLAGESRKQVASVLDTVVGMTRESVKTWEEETRSDVSFWAEQSSVKNAVGELLSAAHDPKSLRGNAALADLRRELLPTVKESGYLDFAIIAADGTQLASLRDEPLGRKDLYTREHPAVATALAGKAAISPTFDVNAEVQRHGMMEWHNVPSLLSVAPIYDSSEQIVAVLGFELDAYHELNVITRPARMNRTGETYIVDRHGRMLTESRFASELNSPDSVVEVRDPGVDLMEEKSAAAELHDRPLTLAASSALKHDTGSNLDGYDDYRGVKVVGSWTWMPDLELGIISEFDKNEAYARYYISRRVTLFLLLTTVAGMLVLSVLRNRFARQRAIVEAREELLAVVAHDLRNPLQSVALNSAILLKLFDAGTFDGKARKCADSMRVSVQRMSTLVEDLLHAAQIEAGKLTVALQRQKLGPIIDNIATVLEPLARDAGIQFAAHVPPELPECNVDPARLSQVLSNLVGNAIKFTPPGGRIDIRVTQQSHDFIQIETSDTGCGIDPQNVPHLFKRYWQAVGGGKAHMGAGLGLFIVKGIVEAHGGRIWAESQPGQGAHILFTLPVAH